VLLLALVMKRTFSQGQTLIEILIAIGVVTLVLVTLVAAVLMALRSVGFSQHKATATFLTNQGLEWVRGQRNILGWADFAVYASVGGSDYCLTDLTGVGLADLSGACGDEDLVQNIYQRTLVLTLETEGTPGSDDDSVTAEVTLVWDEGEATRQVAGTAVLTNWDLGSD
jgi:hypothetical protein